MICLLDQYDKNETAGLEKVAEGWAHAGAVTQPGRRAAGLGDDAGPTPSSELGPKLLAPAVRMTQI
jgi:hypothetical protein